MTTKRDGKEDKAMAMKNEVQRPEWAHEYMRHAGDGQWVCDGCPLESCDCDKHVDA